VTGTVCLQGGGQFSAGCAAMDGELVRRAGGRVVVPATVLGLAEESGVLVEGSTWTPVGRSAARLVDEQRDLPLGEAWTTTRGSTA
jgi:hypothetical protein